MWPLLHLLRLPKLPLRLGLCRNRRLLLRQLPNLQRPRCSRCPLFQRPRLSKRSLLKLREHLWNPRPHPSPRQCPKHLHRLPLSLRRKRRLHLHPRLRRRSKRPVQLD